MPAQLGRQHLRTIVLAGMVGNLMEWYDFGLYGVFAPLIARHFFPAEDPAAALLATFAVFASGLFARPLGGVVFGYVGDRLGRKPALTASVLLMAVPTFCIGLLPTYAELGLWATALLVLMRLLQGVSAGGELTGSAAFLLEQAPPRHRGFMVSWSQAGATSGVVLGSVSGALLAATLPAGAFETWGWRLPFLFGIVIGLIGFFLRRHLDETPAFSALRAAGALSRSPVADTVRHARGPIAMVIGLVCLPTVVTYLLAGYLPSYLESVVGLAPATALAMTSAGLLIVMVLMPLSGALSDRVGRRPLILGWTLVCMALAYPLFALMAQRTEAIVLCAVLLYAVPVAGVAAPSGAAMPEAVPTAVRYTALSIGYNVGLALFGGTAPFIATFLTTATGDPAAPGLYVVAAGLVTLATGIRLTDRYRDSLGSDPVVA
jgi:MHS family proline/betaine transporter-like MFS transporter